ncbi:DUF2332 family protein [Streptomyces sp. SL13]|uniref:DUF2332 family protein n=1 Tax=Streptantibioticus silvisoli TaxID=2705255 RepID=A0AA90H115_9ACTN|nr:DUF2332 family protein [Streptantibioticus silvisoli]MDI5969391.1 DUF2332 family protein [Streptantibioticus silvisoli]
MPVISRRAAAEMYAFADVARRQLPVSGDVMRRFVEELEQGGPLSQVLDGHPDRESPLFYLRALAGVHWLLIKGMVPSLATHLVALDVASDDRRNAERTWALWRAALLEHPSHIRGALDRPVQQHQPGRAGALLTGLGMLPAPGRIRLLEIGACAGLNLLFDKYRWFGRGWQWGDRDSPVRIATSGGHPGAPVVVQRAGCDLAPRDPSNPDDADILRSFIPYERHMDLMELDDALALAAASDLRIDQAEAHDWLASELGTVGPFDCTVVWHSMFWCHLEPAHQRAVEQLLSDAGRRTRIVRIGLEPFEWSMPSRLQVISYS